MAKAASRSKDLIKRVLGPLKRLKFTNMLMVYIIGV